MIARGWYATSGVVLAGCGSGQAVSAAPPASTSQAASMANVGKWTRSLVVTTAEEIPAT